MKTNLNIRNAVVLKEKMLREGVFIDNSILRLLRKLDPSVRKVDCAKILVVNGITVNTILHTNKSTDLSIIAKAGPNNWGNIVIYYKKEELFEAKIIS